MNYREDCLREASECDRLAQLANTQATRALLAVAAFQWRSWRKRQSNGKSHSGPRLQRYTLPLVESRTGRGSDTQSPIAETEKRNRDGIDCFSMFAGFEKANRSNGVDDLPAMGSRPLCSRQRRSDRTDARAWSPRSDSSIT